MISFANDRMRIRFDRFGIDAYDLFLRAKRIPEYQIEFDAGSEAYTIDAPARFADMIGVERPGNTLESLPFPEKMFDDQVAVTRMFLDCKRFACWSQCGNGKTFVGLEGSRQASHKTGRRGLIVTFNDLVQQWIDECEAFYGDSFRLHRINSREEMKAWCASPITQTECPCVAITNYEKFNPGSIADQVVNECRNLGVIVLDENRLRGSGGKQKWALIKSFRGVEYKLSMTATPAPNDTIEFASQASFLEKMRTDADIIWTYFTRDPVSHRWTVKPHARQAFFEFMASWSIYVNNPKHYGWRSTLPDIPDPEYRTIEIEPTQEQLKIVRQVSAMFADEGQGELYTDRTNAIQRMKLSQAAKGFIYRKNKHGKRRIEKVPSLKPAVVAETVRKEVAAGAQVLVWTVFDAETAILADMLKDVAGLDVLIGATKREERVEILDRFRRGGSPCLISRAKMLGFGQNFQRCTAMVYSGWTDSFEAFYQSFRRAVRYGQTERVRLYFPLIPELEGDTFANICRKQSAFERSIAEMEQCYLKALKTMKGAA